MYIYKKMKIIFNSIFFLFYIIMKIISMTWHPYLITILKYKTIIINAGMCDNNKCLNKKLIKNYFSLIQSSH